MVDEAAPAATPLVRSPSTPNGDDANLNEVVGLAPYARVPVWIWTLGPYAVNVFFALSSFEGEKGCFPSSAVLAKRAGISMKTVQRALRTLEHAGAIQTRHRNGRGNVYDLSPAFRRERTTPVPGTTVHDHQPRSLGPGSPVPGTDVTRTKELEGQEVLRTSLPTAKKPRVRDEVWDTLVEVCGKAPETSSGRGAWNRAAKELKAVGATPDEIRIRAANYWPGITITPTSLAKHWTLLATRQSNGQSMSTVDDRVRGLLSVRPIPYDVQHIEREGG